MYYFIINITGKWRGGRGNGHEERDRNGMEEEQQDMLEEQNGLEAEGQDRLEEEVRHPYWDRKIQNKVSCYSHNRLTQLDWDRQHVEDHHTRGLVKVNSFYSH